MGLKFNQAEKKWIYQPDGERTSDCLSSKEAALLSVMEKQVEDGHLEGVLLVTVLDDLTGTSAYHHEEEWPGSKV